LQTENINLAKGMYCRARAPPTCYSYAHIVETFRYIQQRTLYDILCLFCHHLSFVDQIICCVFRAILNYLCKLICPSFYHCYLIKNPVEESKRIPQDIFYIVHLFLNQLYYLHSPNRKLFKVCSMQLF